jgi:hypothetical protein
MASAVVVTVGFVCMYLGLRQLRWWTVSIFPLSRSVQSHTHSARFYYALPFLEFQPSSGLQFLANGFPIFGQGLSLGQDFVSHLGIPLQALALLPLPAQLPS